MNKIIDRKLRNLADSEYKTFNQRIIPTRYEVIGVRIPALKKIAKELAANPDVEKYLENAEYTTYEHILLYGLTVGQLKRVPVGTLFCYLDPLIYKFDNWAHVDTIISSIKVFRKYPVEVLNHYLPLKAHEGEFTKRVFAILLMDYYMTDDYIDTTLIHLSEIPQGQYYVDMAIAWALSYGLIKYYDKTVSLLNQNTFSKFVHNKAIQKARESYRIPPELKEELNRMKMK